MTVCEARSNRRVCGRGVYVAACEAREEWRA